VRLFKETNFHSTFHALIPADRRSPKDFFAGHRQLFPEIGCLADTKQERLVINQGFSSGISPALPLSIGQ
jgi:hypothetical protein